MEHLIPEVPLECLQEILKTLIRSNDPEATFISPATAAAEEPDKKPSGE